MTPEPSILGDAAPVALHLELAPGVPIELEDPSHASLTWERDSEHMPTALTPLAGDYARILGNSLKAQYPLEVRPFPQRWHAAIWHGYVYYAFERNTSDDEWAPIMAEVNDLLWQRALVTEAYWHDYVVPELRELYALIDDIDPVDLAGQDLADAWDSAWRSIERAWQHHMDILPPVFRALDILGELYEAAVPEAPAGEAFRLIQGSDHELVEVERATEQLAALAAQTPAVGQALRSGVRSLDDIGALKGGPGFVAAVNAALAIHGHLGQFGDDLFMPSFGEESELYVAEVAKRLDRPFDGADRRRIRIRREADELAERARSGLSAESLPRFDSVLALARRIGPLTERHNYWIDRMALAALRRLTTRVGERLLRDDVIGRAEDVFYLRRAEVRVLLRQPQDQRALIDRRRAEHEADKRIKPSPVIAAGRAGSAQAPHGADAPKAAEALQGLGASPGVARGRARVVTDIGDFARVAPGDIVVGHASNPSWVPIFAIAGGLVTDVGGMLSHAAVVAREFELPAVVGVENATTAISDGREIEVDGRSGTVRLL